MTMSPALVGILSLVAVLALILSGYARQPGGMRTAVRMFAGGVVVAAIIAVLALAFERL